MELDLGRLSEESHPPPPTELELSLLMELQAQQEQQLAEAHVFQRSLSLPRGFGKQPPPPPMRALSPRSDSDSVRAYRTMVSAFLTPVKSKFWSLKITFYFGIRFQLLYFLVGFELFKFCCHFHLKTPSMKKSCHFNCISYRGRLLIFTWNISWCNLNEILNIKFLILVTVWNCNFRFWFLIAINRNFM